MKPLADIEPQFPEHVHAKKLFMLREYLQYEILKILFNSKYGHRYTFLGGTCLRIAYNTDRFSEDLDFDNRDLTVEEFEETMRIVKRGLELIGYETTIRNVYKGAYHCHLKLPGLPHRYGLSGHKEAKLLIKLDTEKQHYDYKPQLHELKKFGVHTDILIVPLDLLASMKIAAVMGRKRPKGRDYYDLSYILERATPEYGYLDDRFGVTDAEGLRELVNERIAPFDFGALANDVRPFLFLAEDIERVRNFPAYWANVKL